LPALEGLATFDAAVMTILEWLGHPVMPAGMPFRRSL